jgi:hypothetical protein
MLNNGVSLINKALEVTSQILDWNKIEIFANLIMLVQNMLGKYEFRGPALEVLHALIDKGMDIQNKILLILQSQILNILAKFDENEEDQEFFEIVDESVFFVLKSGR